MTWYTKDIGALVKNQLGIPPTNAGAAETVNGAAIDRQGFLSGVLHHACGAAAGTPTGQTVDSKLQDSADGSTDWQDLSPAIAATQLVADDTDAEVDVDLSGARQFIRVVTAVVLTAGTTPTIPVAATVTLGGADETPV